MTRRRMTRREPYIDPKVLHAPGTSLYDDGVYRRRHGLPDKPAALTPEEIAAMDPALLDPYETDADRAMRPGHFNRGEGTKFLAPQD